MTFVACDRLAIILRYELFINDKLKLLGAESLNCFHIFLFAPAQVVYCDNLSFMNPFTRSFNFWTSYISPAISTVSFKSNLRLPYDWRAR